MLVYFVVSIPYLSAGPNIYGTKYKSAKVMSSPKEYVPLLYSNFFSKAIHPYSIKWFANL